MSRSYMDQWELDRIIEEHDPDRDDHLYEEIAILEKKIKDIKKLVEEVNEHFIHNELINTVISNKLFDIKTIINKEEE
jgi:hypothetical protein